MKTILFTMLTLIMATGVYASNQSAENARLCKVFQEKAISYKKSMRSDIYAQKTLQNYENKSKQFCSK